MAEQTSLSQLRMASGWDCYGWDNHRHSRSGQGHGQLRVPGNDCRGTEQNRTGLTVTVAGRGRAGDRTGQRGWGQDSEGGTGREVWPLCPVRIEILDPFMVWTFKDVFENMDMLFEYSVHINCASLM